MKNNIKTIIIIVIIILVSLAFVDLLLFNENSAINNDLSTTITQKNFASVLVHKENLNEMKTNYGYALLVDNELYIDVTLEGESATLDKMKPTDIYAYIDLKEVTKAGENALSIKIKAMTNITVLTQSKNSMILYIDKEINSADMSAKETTTVDTEIPVTIIKDVPLVVNYKYGYYNDKNTNIRIIPDKIQIKGSPEDINDIESISLKDIIDEKKYENDTIITCPIVLPVGIESLNGETAQIEIKFIDTEKKTMLVSMKQSSYVNIIAPKDFEYYIKEENIQIKLLGFLQNLNDITQRKISLNVDLSNLTEKGTYSIPVNIETSDTSVFCVGEYVIIVEVY